MVDRLTKKERSANMSRIRGKDTGPELIVRALLTELGFRNRLHGKNLPGRPDIVIRKLGTVIFVHGCFWHRHRNCKDATVPKTRTAWWINKLEGNAARDKRNARRLRNDGWSVLTVWECQTEKPVHLQARLQRFLSANARRALRQLQPARRHP